MRKKAIDTEVIGAHLVGSVPLGSTDEVFRVCCDKLQHHLRRLPDGETGDRTNWIAWQRAVFSATEQLEPESDDPRSPFAVKPGIDAGEIRFGELGYRAAALESFARFTELKRSGSIPASVRFQVSLPTPLAPVQFYISQGDRAGVEPAYEAALLRELRDILTEIPAGELSIQWDTAVEFGVLEGVFPTFFDNPFEEIVTRLVRLGNSIPDEVELGFHLCYGDSGHKHFVEPQDTGLLAKISNAVCSGVNRTVDWIHLPVPRDRNDEAYFAPLKGLEMGSDTELFLGLLHATDGAEGAMSRMEAARSAVGQFGIATECGLGRRSSQSARTLLALHARMSQPYNESH